MNIVVQIKYPIVVKYVELVKNLGDTFLQEFFTELNIDSTGVTVNSTADAMVIRSSELSILIQRNKSTISFFKDTDYSYALEQFVSLIKDKFEISAPIKIGYQFTTDYEFDKSDKLKQIYYLFCSQDSPLGNFDLERLSDTFFKFSFKEDNYTNNIAIKFSSKLKYVASIYLQIEYDVKDNIPKFKEVSKLYQTKFDLLGEKFKRIVEN